MNQRSEALVISKINILLDSGFIDKDDIIQKIADEFNFAKPIIRRIMKDMILDFQRKTRVLTKQYDKDTKKSELNVD